MLSGVSRTRRVASMERKHFRMPSRRSAVAPTVERILRSLTLAKLGQEQTDNLAVALAEALSNAAVHGHREKPRSLVLINAEAGKDGHVQITVRDCGPGFDVGSLEDPTDPGRLLVPGGRGVFLMRRLVDRLEYNAKGNQVRLMLNARKRKKPR
jgi:serine/threonine-protein kinase RsbW